MPLKTILKGDNHSYLICIYQVAKRFLRVFHFVANVGTNEIESISNSNSTSTSCISLVQLEARWQLYFLPIYRLSAWRVFSEICFALSEVIFLGYHDDSGLPKPPF